MHPAFHLLRRWIASAGLLLVAGFAQAALDTSAATDDHSINTPTGWWTYTSISPADLSARLEENGARLVDLEVTGVTSSGEPRFLARMVANSGAYAVPGWWWYYDQTPAQITTLLNANSGRLIELERYDRGGGQIRHALVMVSNTGSMARGWSYLMDVNARTLSDHITRNNMRPIDLDTTGIGSALRYTGIFVSNTGADTKGFEWASNQTLAGISSRVASFQGRVVKLDRQTDGKYSFVQVKATGSDATAWWHRYGFASLADLNNYAMQFAARPVDVLSYTVGATRYYDASFIDNANAGTRRMRAAFSPFVEASTQTPKGIFAGYLKRLDTGVQIDLNGSRRAETASALKVLHLLHAYRQVQTGADTLGEAFDYYDSPPFGYDPEYPPEDHCPDPNFEIAANRHSTTLQPAMDQMMSISDNRIARAVVKRAGSFTPLNTTASRAGLVGTTLRHNIGCAYYSVSGGVYSPSTLRNDTTAADLAHVYEGVWNKQTLSTANGARDAFLQAANPATGASDSMQAVIAQEAAALGKSSSVAVQFGSLVKRWGKSGSYGTCLGNPADMHQCGQAVSIFSSAGLIGLPIKGSGGVLSTRYISYGTYVSDVPVPAWDTPEEDAVKAGYSHAKDELFRDEIRAALQSW